MVRRKTAWSAKEEQDNKTGKLLIGIFLGLLMVMSIFGFINAFSSPQVNADNVIREAGQVFIPVLDNSGLTYYQTEIANQDFTFSFLPLQVASVNYDAASVDLLRSPGLQVSFVPVQNNTEALDAARASLVIDSLALGVDLTTGIAQPDPRYVFLETIACEQATVENPVLVFSFGNSSGIQTSQNCVVSTAVSIRDLFEQAEFIRYARLGVLPQ